MDSMHNWALWRLVLIALIAFPFVVAVVVQGFRQRHAGDSKPNVKPDDGNAAWPMVGPNAYRKEGDGDVQVRSSDEAVVVERRAA